MERYSPQELAFIGDAIHTLFVREFVLKNNSLKINEIQKLTSQFCSARHQSLIMENYISKILNQDEQEVVRRGRNSKAKHIAKNSTPAQYAKATAFESLIGWLYINNNKERMQELLQISINKE